ncbi:hypothetical protein AB0H73_08875 [Streptomyces olivoreticuli]
MRIKSKIKGAHELKLDSFGELADIDYHFKTKEFQDAMVGFMAEIHEKEARLPRLDLETVRARSREKFGTPRDQVKDLARQRIDALSYGQESPPREPIKPASLPIDLAQQTARAQHAREEQKHERQGSEVYGPLPPIGRRTPKKPKE